MTEEHIKAIKPNTLWDIKGDTLYMRVVDEETKQLFMIVDWPVLSFFEHVDRLKEKYNAAKENK